MWAVPVAGDVCGQRGDPCTPFQPRRRDYVVRVLILAAIPIYIPMPHASTALDHFTLLQNNGLVGMLGLDVLYVVSVALSGLVTLALSEESARP
jgi:hypothetical protein